MQTSINKHLIIVAATFLAAMIAVPAQADLTITTRSTQLGSTSGNLSKSQRALVDKFSTTTWYVSGDNTRMDTAMFTVICRGNRSYLLDSANKNYIVATGSVGQIRDFLTNGIGQSQSSMGTRVDKITPVPGHKGDYIGTMEGPGMITVTPASGPDDTRVVKIVDTHNTSVYLGHKVERYIEILQSPVEGSSQMVPETADILVATDIPPAEVAAFKKTGQENPAWAELPGIPLKTTTTVPAGSPDALVTVEAVTSISTKPLPASTFAIPRGYRPAQTGEQAK